MPATDAIEGVDYPSLKEAVENLSKIVALVVVALYICGFLIVSLNDFRYGFADFDPLRPRILTAGAWFGIAVAVPLTLVNQLIKHKAWRSGDKWWSKAGTLGMFYWGSCTIILLAANAVFLFDQNQVPVPTISAWKAVAILVSGLVGVFVLILVLRALPPIFREFFPVPVLAFFLWTSYKGLFWDGKFYSSAVLFWMFAVGAIFLFELKFRSWQLRAADWHTSLIVILVALLFFSRTYYPHIKASWGGGSPIPVSITLTRDAAFSPSKRIGCILVDETDQGVYIVGRGDRFASYIPKNSIGLIYFADISESTSLK